MEFFLREKTQKLVEKLPKDDTERNNWLVEHGTGNEADRLRVMNILKDTSTSPDTKADLIIRLLGAPQAVYNNCNPAPIGPGPKQRPHEWK